VNDEPIVHYLHPQLELGQALTGLHEDGAQLGVPLVLVGQWEQSGTN
jgi:hypothetical protein